MNAPNFPALLQSYFTDRLLHQRQASAHTIAGYRDCFRMLLQYAVEQLGKSPSDLELEDLDTSFIGDFLDYLETTRANSARTRNARLAAIQSFFRYVALQEPACVLLCKRILAMPAKRYKRRPIDFLNREEIEALIAAPDLTTWIGRRNRMLLVVAIQTGLRLSELISLRLKDLSLDTGAHVRCEGKGRKHRSVPLSREVVRVLKVWLLELDTLPETPLFPSNRGQPLSPDAVQYLIAKYVAVAQKGCPSLKSKRVSPHVLRHTAAMELLQHGVDRTVIALWLGHESVETTQMYLHADMRMKERALERTTPLGVKPGKFQPDDRLLVFLEGL